MHGEGAANLHDAPRSMQFVSKLRETIGWLASFMGGKVLESLRKITTKVIVADSAAG